MNDRLRIAAMALQGMLAGPGKIGLHPELVAVQIADALLAAAGEQETREPRQGEIDRHMLGQALDAALARAEAAEARASALQAKLDEAAWLARETAVEAAMLMRRMATLTEAELRMVNCGVGEAITMSEIKAVLEVADEIKRGRK